MSYNKKIWKNGDYVTQEDINNIENGIYEAHKDIANMNEDIADINNDLGTAILNTTDKTLKGAINELFQFVSNGKELIARAITDKGVITSKTDTFQQMANNIRSLTINITPIFLNPISNIKVNKGEAFTIFYSTNISAVKHEFSWDGGKTYWDKTDAVTSNGTNYTYQHNADTEYDSFNMVIRVTDANGNTSAQAFTILFNNTTNDDFVFTQYKRLDNGVITDTEDATYYSVINKNSVTPSATYTINLNLASYIYICFYDSSDNYLGNESGGYIENHTSNWSTGSLSTTFTVPSNAFYIRACATGDGTQITGTLTKTTQSEPDIGDGNLLDDSGAYVVDDFSSGYIDSNKWTYELGYVRNGETQRYTNTNAEVSDGILALRGLKDGDGNWTSSSIISKGRFAFMYGKIVARVRACNYNGAFGAFWTLGDTFEFGYNEWGSPSTLGEWWAWCGEFDIMEFYNGKLTCGTFFNERDESGRVHYDNYSTGDWHEFGMEWLQDGTLIFSIDGNELSRTPATDNRAFHIPHYILLNQAIGAAGGTPDDWCSEITQYVDWVKYYPASTDNLVLNSSDFSLEVTDINDSAHNCMVRPVFNDNCINKSVTWSSSNTDVIICHSGLCVSWAGANGTSTITATSQSGATASITLTVSDGIIRQS
jgi:hypothetical protein